MPKEPKRRFEYLNTKSLGPSLAERVLLDETGIDLEDLMPCDCQWIVATPTEEYRFAVEHTFSKLEIAAFCRASNSAQRAIEAAKRRGWLWFTNEDFHFLEALYLL